MELNMLGLAKIYKDLPSGWHFKPLLRKEQPLVHFEQSPPISYISHTINTTIQNSIINLPSHNFKCFPMESKMDTQLSTSMTDSTTIKVLVDLILKILFISMILIILMQLRSKIVENREECHKFLKTSKLSMSQSLIFLEEDQVLVLEIFLNFLSTTLSLEIILHFGVELCIA